MNIRNTNKNNRGTNTPTIIIQYNGKQKRINLGRHQHNRKSI